MNTRIWDAFDVGNISEWPATVKYWSAIVFLFLWIGLGYWMMIESRVKHYDNLIQQENFLRIQFENKQARARHLPAYRQQLFTMQHYFDNCCKQLVTQNEMPRVLADLSKLGIACGLSFELFAPQPQIEHDVDLELPIHLIVVGHYHQLVQFLSRLVEMNKMVIPHDFEISPYRVESDSVDLLKEKKQLKNKLGLLMMKLTLDVYQARERCSNRVKSSLRKEF